MLQTFRASPPSRQLMLIGGIGLLLCALLAVGYFAFFRTNYEILYRDLREADAATVVAELERTHRDYRLADGGHTVLVPEGAVDTTRLHVAGQDLPLQGTVGFELFNNSSIGLTEFAQRINLQRALQGELARTIMSIDGIESARVHLSLGEQTAFRGDRRAPRASVTVRTRPGRRMNGTTVRGIQRLVAGSVPEMEPANVAVLNDRGALVSADLPVAPAVAPGDEERRRVESFFEGRIRRAMEGRFPTDSVDVTVWAGLDESRGRPTDVQPIQPSAEGRDFRLRATVAIASPLSAAAREQITRTIEDAIGFDAGRGDAVTVTASAPVAAMGQWNEGAEAPEPPLAAPRETAPAAAPGLLGALWTPLLILLLIGALLALLRRRGGAGARMSERERIAYVARLKALLAERSPDARPPA